MNNHPPKLGLALGSGGAKGFAHIGVLKSLCAHNIPISGIAGSSIGALIGAYFAAYPDTKKLEDLALSFSRKQGFRLIDPTFKGGLLKGEKIESLINEILEDATFDKLKIPFAAVATDFNTAEPVVLTKGDLVKAIRSSISVPAFFRPVNYNHQLLSDGGLSNPVPVDVLRDMNMDLVLAVNLDTIYTDKEVKTNHSLSSIPMHSISILRHHLALQSTKSADIVIAPIIPYQIGILGWSYFFDTEKSKEIIKAGEDATDAIIPELKKLIEEWEQVKKEKSRLSKLFSYFRNRS